MKRSIKKTISTMAISVCVSIFAGGLAADAQTRDVKTPSATPTPIARPNPIATPTPSKTVDAVSQRRVEKDKKKIIVVLDFDNVSPQCRDEIYGRNVATQLSTAFAETGEYTVIEKQRIDKIFEEQGISQGERFSPESAAIVGNVVSANTVVLGTITQCSSNTKVINMFGVKSIRHTVKVGLAIRLVDINSAEIQEALTENASETDTSVCVPWGCKITPITTDLQITLFNKAVESSVKKTVIRLGAIIAGREKPIAIEKIAIKPKVENDDPDPVIRTSSPQQSAPNPAKSTGKIVAVNGITLYVSGLSKAAKIGDVLSVLRGREITNAETGAFLDFDGKEIAKAEVFEVNEGTVKARIISGTGVKELDFVKLLK